MAAAAGPAAASGLDALQAGAIATGLPFTVVLLIVVVGILKGLRSERDGVSLEEVAASQLFEGEGEAEVMTQKPKPELRHEPAPPGDEPTGRSDA